MAPSKKMTYAVVAVASLAAVPTAFGQCPVASFDSFDFSNVMSGCGSLGSAEGCDACFAALLSPAVSVLQYLPIDENSTCDSFRAAVADTLSGCQDGFAGAIQGQLGFRAAGLLGLRNCPAPTLDNSPQVTQVASNYYQSQGVDVSSLCA